MLMRRNVFSLVLMCSLGALAAGDEIANAKATLEKAGLRVLSTGVALPNEGDLAKELGKSTLLRRNLNQAQKDLQVAEHTSAAAQNALTQLKQQHVRLSAQLASVGPHDVLLNNKLVGALNSLAGQHELAQQQSAKFAEHMKALRAKATQAREAYIQLVVNTRRLADSLEADYAAKAADPALQAAITRLNLAAGKQFPIAPSSTLQATLRRLKQLEDTVLAESIDLQDDGGKTLRVSVAVNGKYQQDMVLDSGASLVTLPLSVAAKFGLKPTEKDPKITLQLADGRQIEAHLMKLNSVRIGKFTVDNVECAVLGNDAVNAEPLLGMSFLENFKFEIDSADKKLALVKITGSETAASRSAR